VSHARHGLDQLLLAVVAASSDQGHTAMWINLLSLFFSFSYPGVLFSFSLPSPPSLSLSLSLRLLVSSPHRRPCISRREENPVPATSGSSDPGIISGARSPRFDAIVVRCRNARASSRVVGVDRKMSYGK